MTVPALEALHAEHRTIARMLDLFDRQLDLLSNGRQSDVDVLKEIIDYFRTYPDLYHHPKEELILRSIARRDPSARGLLTEMANEHEAGSADLVTLSRALVAMLMEPETETHRFLDEARAFISHERQHMAWEDGNFFDLAVATLTDADWADIDARIAALGEPRFERTARDQFQHLGEGARRWRG